MDEIAERKYDLHLALWISPAETIPGTEDRVVALIVGVATLRRNRPLHRIGRENELSFGMSLKPTDDGIDLGRQDHILQAGKIAVVNLPGLVNEAVPRQAPGCIDDGSIWQFRDGRSTVEIMGHAGFEGLSLWIAMQSMQDVYGVPVGEP
jgi:hypothetical protein